MRACRLPPIEPADLTAPVYWTRRDRDAQVLSVRGRLAEAVSCSAAWSGQGKEGDTAYVAACGFESARRSAGSSHAPTRWAPVSRWSARGTSGLPRPSASPLTRSRPMPRAPSAMTCSVS